ncbi:class I SAM-dependent DNA methyltransferase [Modestobacter marinus]|uniref:site-specific DNA-methyltransferase (adenine-specific) n=1 Tax=Modestobacter marinus TaxID=477641 RepID=A0ABQ2GBI5_9ACTN|nr:putative DNA methyltransferase YeeA [Modestobacter marinus]
MVTGSKPPSWNEIRRRARAFVPRWADATSEQGQAQTFWIEFLGIFGVDLPRVALFEQHVKRTSTGKDGRIDLYWPGTLVVEHKSAGKSLEDAEAQALDYLDDLDVANLPQVVITSDFQHLRLLDMTQPGATAVTIKLQDLEREIDRFGFIAGYTRRSLSAAQERTANVEAATLMGRLYEALSADGYEDHHTSVLLTRLLLLMFGDDTGLWQKALFTELIETRTAEDGSDVGSQLAALFQVLDTPIQRRPRSVDEVMGRFPYVNGRLFTEVVPIPFFDADMRRTLLDAAAFDWSQISPAIFGSLFQAVKDRVARRELGEHYTSEANILKVIRPLFLDELEERLAAADSIARLTSLRTRLGQLRFLDPACGCGNFLVITYRELRRLELEILRRLRNLSGNQQLALDVTLDLTVSLDQFFGIEIEEWPAQIAEVAMFLIDQQENIALAKEFGDAPDRLPITTAATIVPDNALTVDWQDVVPASADVIILGNPPFVGRSVRSPKQVGEMKKVWGKAYNVNLDYVTCWYAMALRYFGDLPGRWAFVSTNSVSQGEPVARLWRPILAAGWRARFAHRSFRWDSEAPGRAAVHVSIIGFDRAKTSPRPLLWRYPEGGIGDSVRDEVVRINPYLVEGPNVLVDSLRKPLNPQLPPALFGSMPNDGGHLLINTAAEHAEVMADPVAAEYVRPIVGADELLSGRQRWCLWLVDLDPADVAKSPLLRERLANVKAVREASRNPDTVDAATTPHLFWHIAQPTSRYLCIPGTVSERRRYATAAYFEPDVISSNKNFVAADPDGFAFGIVSSAMFVTWMKTIGGRLKSDLSFSGTFTYNTFPLPTVTDRARLAITKAAHEVLAARAAHPAASLAQLYNPVAMPADLVKAHGVLDKAVDKAFATTAIRTVEERQRVLFRQYAALTNSQDSLL